MITYISGLQSSPSANVHFNAIGVHIMLPAGLYVVATPIGNLEDITYRAVRILGEADRVAAEDTRHSRVLLSHYDITTPMLALHEHNETQLLGSILEYLKNGEAIALISDAGTPLISDPGYRLVRAAREAGLPVHVIPGPSAITAALSVAGIAPDSFVFEGFLPAKAVARKKKLESLSREPRTMVFFESSHRIEASVRDMSDIFGGERIAAICRELTKKFETVLRAPLEQAVAGLAADSNQSRGEFVIVIEGYQAGHNEAMTSAQLMAAALMEYLPVSQAARVAAKLNHVSRRELYRLLED
jgi:16S rRNA (cytidine1402-2'-O)-methyltransferase